MDLLLMRYKEKYSDFEVVSVSNIRKLQQHPFKYLHFLLELLSLNGWKTKVMAFCHSYAKIFKKKIITILTFADFYQWFVINNKFAILQIRSFYNRIDDCDRH